MVATSPLKPLAPLGSLALKLITQAGAGASWAASWVALASEGRSVVMWGPEVEADAKRQARAPATSGKFELCCVCADKPLAFAIGPSLYSEPIVVIDTEPVSETRTWMCLICGWIYDEAAGDPEHGLAAGTAWADVPMNWTCPECGARKEDFEMVQI
jgi:rubredoxin